MPACFSFKIVKETSKREVKDGSNKYSVDGKKATAVPSLLPKCCENTFESRERWYLLW
jgi:hypothetical protein